MFEEAVDENDEVAKKGAMDGKTPTKGAHHKDARKGAANSQHVFVDACLWRCPHPRAGIHLGGHIPRSMRRAVSASGDACFAVCGHSSCSHNFELIIKWRSMFSAWAGDTVSQLGCKTVPCHRETRSGIVFISPQ